MNFKTVTKGTYSSDVTRGMRTAAGAACRHGVAGLAASGRGWLGAGGRTCRGRCWRAEVACRRGSVARARCSRRLQDCGDITPQSPLVLDPWSASGDHHGRCAVASCRSVPLAAAPTGGDGMAATGVGTPAADDGGALGPNRGGRAVESGTAEVILRGGPVR